MNEQEHRARVIELAREWRGTPYISNAMVKGRKGGVDCAMILVDVYCEAKIVPPEFDPRPYPPQWHVHRGEERYMDFVKTFAKEIDYEPSPGDVVLFKLGRLFAHGAIVVAWPRIIHAKAPGPVIEEDVSRNNTGKHALWNVDRKYFSFWGK